ncbi:ATP-binding protein [Roseimicrobium gellanilyticum]|uniref:sensor histidine kinase n=1 Tax=Roseimicrobium gellanilyticum TaxID=748857 RepID=UPI000DEA1231
MLARGLSPVQVEMSGLMSALKSLTDHGSTLFKVSCNFHCDEPVHVEDHGMATHVYRIAQEAIHNAVRHGKARRIDVVLSRDKTGVVLRILSDGDSGPVAQLTGGDGMGLHTMTYRARLIGGELQIHPRESSGTEVVCTFPWE